MRHQTPDLIQEDHCGRRFSHHFLKGLEGWRSPLGIEKSGDPLENLGI
jgi:hypothetical protein